MKKLQPIVSVIMGSDSDWPVMQKAVHVLKDFNVSYEVKVVSAHRTAQAMQSYALRAKNRGVKIIIAGAGGAAHLPGMVASLTCLPVIGVPVMTRQLKGWDSLLSILQMPTGTPVASVAVDNAHNGALLAIRILALSKGSLTKKLTEYNKKQKQKTRQAEKNIQERKKT